MLSTTANRITLLRIALVPVLLVLAYTGHRGWALAVYALACLSDFLDGYVARHYHQSSTAGKFMDPLADKILVLSVMCFFIETGQMKGWWVAPVLLREFAVSGLRLIAAERGLVIAAAPSGKIKTAVTMICLGLMLLFPAGRVLNAVCGGLTVAVTVWSGIEYFAANAAILKS